MSPIPPGGELGPGGGGDADQVQANLDAHIVDGTDAHMASAIGVVDAGGYYAGSDVETVLQEIGPQLGGGGSTPPLPQAGFSTLNYPEGNVDFGEEFIPVNFDLSVTLTPDPNASEWHAQGGATLPGFRISRDGYTGPLTVYRLVRVQSSVNFRQWEANTFFAASSNSDELVPPVYLDLGFDTTDGSAVVVSVQDVIGLSASNTTHYFTPLGDWGISVSVLPTAL